MKRYLRIICLVLALLMCGAVLAGCGGQQAPTPATPQPEKPKEPSVLRLNATAQPNYLDPAQANWAVEIRILRQVFVGLVGYNESKELVMKIAEKVDISPDGKTYTFTLRPGVKFHNGREVTAEDFVYSLTRALKPETKSAVAMLYLNDIVGAKDVADGNTDVLAGVKAVDKYTLAIEIDEVKPYFLAKLTYPTAYVVAREEVERLGESWVEGHLAGAGPFTLDNWAHNEKITLKAFPDYFEGTPTLDVIEWLMITDENTALLMYKNNELDVTEVPALQYEQIKNDPQLGKEMRQQPRASIEYFTMNRLAFEPFEDVRVRQALAMAIDRVAHLNVIYRNTRTLASSFTPPGVPGYDPNAYVHPFDPEKAKQLLAEAGYPDPSKFPKLTISYRTQPNQGPQAEFFQGQLQQNLGIPVELEGLEGTTYTQQRNAGAFQAFFGGWGCDYLDPQNVLSLLFSTKSRYSQRWGSSNPEFDAYADAADLELDVDKRIELYKQADKVLINSAIMVPMTYPDHIWLQKPYVKGYERDASDVIPLFKARIEK